MLILERLEAGVLIIFLINIFTTVANFYHVLVRMITEIYRFPEKANTTITWILFPIVYALAVYLKNIQELERWIDWLSITHFIVIGFAILCLVIAVIRKKKGSPAHELDHPGKKVQESEDVS
jgi:hypothetical protein